MGKYVDLTGKKFDHLTVLGRADKTDSSGNSYWNCQCDCGKKTIVAGCKLKSGSTKSCGCANKERFAKYAEDSIPDLVGQRFGKLTVLERLSSQNGATMWRCKCDCGNETIVKTNNLTSGKTKSCGCLRIDICKERIIPCDYFIDDLNTVHVTLRTGEEMLCDLDDWDRLKYHGWRLGDTGYASCRDTDKNIKFHIEVMGRKEGYVIDHINHNRLDNRKSNLRFVTVEVNALNRVVQSNSQTGIKGVHYNKKDKKWEPYIGLHNKHYHLGQYKTVEEAQAVREKAVELLHAPIIESECLYDV